MTEVRLSADELITALRAFDWGDRDVQLGIAADFRCQYCALDLLASVDAYKAWQLDHLIPLSSDGPDHESNLVVSCRTCNFIKGRWVPPSWRREKVQFLPVEWRGPLIQEAREHISATRARLQMRLAEIRLRVVQLDRTPPRG